MPQLSLDINMHLVNGSVFLPSMDINDSKSMVNLYLEDMYNLFF